MSSQTSHADTIAAIATPPGVGGVGIIRISGAQAKSIGESLCGFELEARKAHFANFTDIDKQTMDSGLAIYFPNPSSFTGEDVVEIHGHGGPIVQDMLLQAVVSLGARLARAGEFSERAFLNDKIDLVQAEAIADLIESATHEAARGAVRSLQGEFSNKVKQLLKELIYLRTYVEAAIDFPDEEIDFLADTQIRDQIETLQNNLSQTLAEAGQGAVLRNGFRLVIAGKPNAGKSSLLNALSGQDSAIVTNIPGTTRDIVSETIDLDGLPVHIIDTAGLRESSDEVEQIGIQRARQAIDTADHVLHLIDLSEMADDDDAEFDTNRQTAVTKVYNKQDIAGTDSPDDGGLSISAKTGEGLEALRSHIKSLAGFTSGSETNFTARRRHLDALERTRDAVKRGIDELKLSNSGELLAEELKIAQDSLNEITGEFSSDDLLGEIFSGFCIGK